MALNAKNPTAVDLATPSDDRTSGAYSDDPPWNVDPAALSWRVGLAEQRRRVRAMVPELTRRRRVPPVLRLARVSSRLGLALVRWRIAGRSRTGRVQSRRTLAREMRRACEDLGSTFIKLGQIISSGQGLFPPELVKEFAACRDAVPAEPFETVRRVVEEDLGRPLESVFVEFDREPLAAASIAQVHRAVLCESFGGRVEVVVKVQRPSIAEVVHTDIEVMAWIAERLVGRIPVAALANPPALVEVFAQSIVEELDFRLEAENMVDVASSLAETDQRAFVVPRPHPDLVTERVLVMERLSGFAFDDVARIEGAGLDTHEIIRSGMIAFLEGCLLHGIFHGDLHGGNLFVRPDGRTALLDHGITGRLTEPKRRAFLRLVLAATVSNPQGQLEALRDLGALPVDTDIAAMVVDLGLDRPAVDPTTLERDELVAELNRIMRALMGYGARMPRELLLFAKNLVFLDAAIGTLAPELDLFAEITHISGYFAENHGSRLAAEVGMRPEDYEVDLTALKGQFGVDPETEQLSYAELLERRELIRRRLG